jgi:putative SOS response-associated peptidase YedK
MCGRYSQTAALQTLQERFALRGTPRPLSPRYNIAPGQEAPIIVAGRSLRSMRWGFGARVINARAETAASRPAFRKAFSCRRCLVPADGFYEWSRSPKLPYRFAAVAGGLFAFAGLWDSRDFVILTTAADAVVRAIHPRMPVILAREAEGPWLDPSTPLERVTELLVPGVRLTCCPVSERVNSTENDDEGCIERRREQQQLEL